ncbi:MAG: tetratricopeptide repeat protein [Candidatus Aminicenantes bacterium]
MVFNDAPRICVNPGAFIIQDNEFYYFNTVFYLYSPFFTNAVRAGDNQQNDTTEHDDKKDREWHNNPKTMNHRKRMTIQKTVISAAGFFLAAVLTSGFTAALPGEDPLAGYSAQARQLDPFYIRMLEKGKESFLAGRHQDAATELEVGIFGLQSRPRLQGEGHIYLALAYAYMEDLSQARNHLTQAAGLLKREELWRFELPSPHKQKLEDLLAESGFRRPELRDEAGSPVIDPEATLDPDAGVPVRPDREETIQSLEQRLESHPEETETYLRLYSLYFQAGETGEAEKVIKKLIRHHPDSARGYYLLGRLHYRNREYKKAEQHFARVFLLSSGTSVTQEILLMSRAYQLISVYLRGDRERAVQMAAGSLEVLTDEQVQELALTAVEKKQLLHIMETARKQHPAAHSPLDILSEAEDPFLFSKKDSSPHPHGEALRCSRSFFPQDNGSFFS